MEQKIFSQEDIKRAELYAYSDNFRQVPVTLIGGEFNELIKFLQSMGSQVKFIDNANQMGAIPVGNVQIGWFLVKTVEQGWQVGIVVHYRAETLLKWLAKQWKLNRIDL